MLYNASGRWKRHVGSRSAIRIKSISLAVNSASSNASKAALVARSDGLTILCNSSSLIPVRFTIHSFEVSTICSKSLFVIIFQANRNLFQLCLPNTNLLPFYPPAYARVFLSDPIHYFLKVCLANCILIAVAFNCYGLYNASVYT